MGGRQIDGDAAHREGEAAVFDGRPYPVSGLVDSSVGEAHHIEGGQSAGQITFGGNRIAGHSMEPQGTDGEDHGKTSCCRAEGPDGLLDFYFTCFSQKFQWKV